MSACCASCARGLPCEGTSIGASVADFEPWPPVEIGAGLFGELPAEVRAVDDVVSSIWSAARPFVPYGDVIDTAHRARREAMYGPEATARRPSRPSRTDSGGAPSPAVRELQRLTRSAARGDRAARRELGALKSAAGRGDADARRRWAAAVAVMTDDDRRVDRLTTRGT